MTAAVLIKHMEPKPPPVLRVRARTTKQEGYVLDVLEDGWVIWVGDDLSCHISAPDYVENVS
jgi:hypothetical protein